MPDIIQLLPESVANQIAAGEVIQRPASVVKELVENSIDAGSTSISIVIKDAGRTLIQVIDNGKGMSETDARMSFERHATSKIRKADDLFAIRSIGFRGEALASIAAVAEVVLQTKRNEDEMGTEIFIRATEFVSQEAVACNTGTTFSVKNLFFNVPARRKFLKSEAYEFRLCISELQRVALAFPNIEFKMLHNNTEILHLAPCNYKQRIIELFGKSKNQDLIEIKTNTSITKIRGYIGKPESAKKSQDAQFFFVNNRFMRHPYYHKAVINAYERILPPNVSPAYFIYFEVDPEKIDVNIHPTKTEIKFEDEQAIWQILHATVKESLGKFSMVPSLDFNTEASIEIPVLTKNTRINIPSIQIDPTYNPFENEDIAKQEKPRFEKDYFKQNNLQNWEKLYTGFENENKETPESENQKLFNDEEDPVKSVTPNILQLKNKYILSPVKSGLLIIDQKRAHERILYEKYLKILSEKRRQTQQSLYPLVIELSGQEHNLIIENIEEINQGGFDIQDFGNNTIVVNGCPADIPSPNPKELVERLIDELQNNPKQAGKASDYMAVILCKASAIPYGKVLTINEMRDLIDRLFACENYNFNPDGKPILSIIQLEELEKKLR
jgi:DNA mismatch repair protein MutL